MKLGPSLRLNASAVLDKTLDDWSTEIVMAIATEGKKRSDTGRMDCTVKIDVPPIIITLRPNEREVIRKVMNVLCIDQDLTYIVWEMKYKLTYQVPDSAYLEITANWSEPRQKKPT